MQVAIVLHRQARPDLTVVLIGGVRTPSDALVGPIAMTALGTLHVDMLFMGVHGMAVDSGFTTPNLLESDTNRAMIASAEQLAVVVDHTKWGVRGLSRMAELAEAQVLVSDEGLAQDAQSVLSEHVGRLIVAPTAR
jgi:DeoR/GlpR family transcriptional regulator of sugar metabolism